MNIEIVIIIAFAAAVVGAVIGALVRGKLGGSKIANAERTAVQIVDVATKEADSIRKESIIQAKDTVLQAKTEWEAELRELRKEAQSQERRLQQKEENIDRKVDQIDSREEELQKREQFQTSQEQLLKEREQEVESLVQDQRVQLEKISGMSTDEAKNTLIASLESEARHDAAKMIKQIEDEAKESADKKARNILALTIQRYAGDFVAEKTVSVVPLPADEMKGRIIGREGRNIRAIEAATGIDLIIDDTPEAVIISGFNPVRRSEASPTSAR